MGNESDFKQRFLAFHADHPGVPLREAAAELETNEAELLSFFVGDGATRLNGETLTPRLPLLGRVLWETRTAHAILKSRSEFLPESLQVEIAKISHLYHVEEETHEGSLDSLQAFAADGEAVLKIYLLPESDRRIFESIIAEMIHTEQRPLSTLSASHHQTPNFKPTGDHVTPHVVRSLFTAVQQEALPLTITLENQGTRHQHRSSVQKAYPWGPWFVAQGGDFEFRIRTRALGSGFVEENQNLRLYDKTGETMGVFTIDGEPGHSWWRNWLAQVPRLR